MPKLTAQMVENAAPQPEKQPARYELLDTLMPGLRLVVQPSGVKSWAVRYSFGRRKVKLTLGRFPVLSLADARERAQAELRKVARGIDPAKEKRTGDGTFADAVTLYKAGLADLRPGTRHYVERELDAAVGEWGKRAVAEIGKRDVIAYLDTVAKRGPTVRGITLRVLSAFFSWCLAERDLIQVNPAAGLKRGRRPERDRALNDEELAAVWKAADAQGNGHGALVKLLILTGCRRNEIANLEWSEVTPDAIKLPAERTKTGHELTIAMTPTMRRIIDGLPRTGRYVLTGKSTPLRVSGNVKNPINDRLPANFLPWRLHDLRRSFASGLQRLGIPFEVIEAALNHEIKGTAGIYQRHAYGPERADALAKWSKHIEQLATTK